MKEQRQYDNHRRRQTAKTPLVVSIKQARHILGKEYSAASDETIENILYSMQLLISKSLYKFQK